MRLDLWGAGMPGLDGVTVVLVPVNVVGSGVLETGSALAAVGGRRAGMRVAGVGAMPVGAAGQLDLAKRARRSMPWSSPGRIVVGHMDVAPRGLCRAGPEVPSPPRGHRRREPLHVHSPKLGRLLDRQHGGEADLRAFRRPSPGPEHLAQHEERVGTLDGRWCELLVRRLIHIVVHDRGPGIAMHRLGPVLGQVSACVPSRHGSRPPRDAGHPAPDRQPRRFTASLRKPRVHAVTA